MTNESLSALLRQIEGAVDRTDVLTRIRPSGLVDTAKFSFSDGQWSVNVTVRNTISRGRGSRSPFEAKAEGASPESAVANFMERIPYFVEATS